MCVSARQYEGGAVIRVDRLLLLPRCVVLAMETTDSGMTLSSVFHVPYHYYHPLLVVVGVIDDSYYDLE